MEMKMMNQIWRQTKQATSLTVVGIISLGALLQGCDSIPFLSGEGDSSSSENSESLERSVAQPGEDTVGAGNTSDTSSSQEAPSQEDSSQEAPSSETASSGEVDLQNIFGTAQDGWLPKVLATYDLQRGMPPAEAGKKIPGSEAISKFGFSEVPIQDVPGIERYKFSFQEDKATGQRGLYSVTLIFDPKTKADLPFDQVAQALVPKYGEIKPGMLEKQIVTWIGPRFASAQLTTRQGNFEGHQFKIVIPKT